MHYPYLSLFSYTFCWGVSTLSLNYERGNWQRRNPAMAAGLDDRVWSMYEWLSEPATWDKPE